MRWTVPTISLATMGNVLSVRIATASTPPKLSPIIDKELIEKQDNCVSHKFTIIEKKNRSIRILIVSKHL